MEYVVGIDLGTSAVKTMLLGRDGAVAAERSQRLALIQDQVGHSEQDPEAWVNAVITCLRQLPVQAHEVKGISLSGQMHGLVLLNKEGKPLRHAILWNDTRTTAQCEYIHDVVGRQELQQITNNWALEGFTLPKLLWVKEHEPEIYEQAEVFLLPKDYVRYRLTGVIGTDYSDAAGTLLLDTIKKAWSNELMQALHIKSSMCPPIFESTEEAGRILSSIGCMENVPVFAGGADNACGAVGAGVLEHGDTLASIGTSGVVLSQSSTPQTGLHFFNHASPHDHYIMGVTLSAGDALEWFRKTFASQTSYSELMHLASQSVPGANGLLFAPYINGERMPHTDAKARGSFIGIDRQHTLEDFARAVVEGITYSLNDCLQFMHVDQVIAIGGGARSSFWLQMQADIFNRPVITRASEQGPGYGAAIIATVGCGWYSSLKECARDYLTISSTYQPSNEYGKAFKTFQEVYNATKLMNDQLTDFRKSLK